MKHAIIALAATTATAFVARTAPVRAHVLRAEEGVAAEPVVAEVAEEKPKRADKSKATPLADLVEGNEYAALSASYVDDVASVVKEGDDVTVRILKIDSGKKQLSLSMKPEGAEAPPKKRGGGGRQKKAGAEELRKYQDADPAEFISGTVRTVLEWGAFVNIAPGVDGLVHISRVSDSRVEDLQAELSVGDEVKVRIIDVDLDKATLGLAMNTYRDPTAPPRPGRDDAGGESAAARRARNPDAAGGGQRKPRRMDPGDDIWENKDSFNWKDVLAEADVGDADDMSSGFSVDLETGKLTLQ
ncbi:hypothetical protein JL722_10913 [Aureococcus anophagefferens]|nr:hypothetical protein JL722_10913 [Aureococcus anophagefferens]